jgi:3',5'-cyclic AMP phosphodiesterase CpdA
MSRRSISAVAAMVTVSVFALAVEGSTGGATRKSRHAGTTQRRTIAGDGDRTLKFGNGAPRITRALGWSDTRGYGRPLVAFKHLSDVHILDEESPGRVEWFDGCETPFSAAYRVHEAMTTQIGNAMLKRLAGIKRGPVTGIPFKFAVSTGDNVDNNQENETEWFIRLLNGQRVNPNSGGPGYHGYTREQFSEALPVETLRRAQRPFDAVGTKIPWYAVLGNHDGLVQGNAPRNDGFNDISVGDAKVFADVEAQQDCPDDPNDFQDMQDLLQEAITDGSEVRQVPADPKRRFLTHKQLVDEYLASNGRPRGHGLARAPKDAQHDSRAGYYSFKINRRIRGISLDTIAYDGVANGHIPDPQWDWLVRKLREWSSYRYVNGKRRTTRSGENKLIVLFSHHSSVTLNNPGANEEGAPYHCFRRNDTPECQDAGGLKGLLHRYPNVVLWVNGHEHNNAIRFYPWNKAHSERGFVEINTASHVDWPQQARLIEMAWKPGRGSEDTILVHTTMVDHKSRLRPNANEQSNVDYLASLARVESYVDACLRTGQANCEASGTRRDQNVKIVMKAPFDLGRP